MEKTRKKDLTENYFGTLPTVHIYAKYQDGKFTDIETEKEVVLSNGSVVKMVALRASIVDVDYLKIAEEFRKKVLPKGVILFIRVPVLQEGEYVIKVILKEDLYMKKKGNKVAVFESCKCEVISRQESGRIKNMLDFKPFEAGSLNQAFFQASVLYRPNNKSHSANIYQCCYLEDGRSISVLRF